VAEEAGAERLGRSQSAARESCWAGRGNWRPGRRQSSAEQCCNQIIQQIISPYQNKVTVKNIPIAVLPGMALETYSQRRPSP